MKLSLTIDQMKLIVAALQVATPLSGNVLAKAAMQGTSWLSFDAVETEMTELASCMQSSINLDKDPETKDLVHMMHE